MRFSDGDVGLAGTDVTYGGGILPFPDILTPCQFHDQPLVQAGIGCEVKAVQGLDHRKAGFPDTSFGPLLLALDQLQLGQLRQEPGLVTLLFGALRRHLLVLAKEDRQSERLEMMRQKR